MDSIDKYARDAATWVSFAEINCRASLTLFDSNDPFLLFPALALAHHALEMYLKASLIRNGMAIVEPSRAARAGIQQADCAWGHKLLALAKVLSEKCGKFDLRVGLVLPGMEPLWTPPKTLAEGLASFDPYFSELRYPQEMRAISSFGSEQKLVLVQLVENLRPFAE